MRIRRLRGEYVLGVLFGLAAAFSYGSSQVVAKKVVTDLAPPNVSAVFAVLFGMVGLFFVGFRDLPGGIRAPRHARGYLLLSGVFSSMGVLFAYIALSRAPVVVVSPVAAVSPLFSVLLSYLFLRSLERVTLKVAAGALLVVLGVVLVVLSTTA